MLTIENLQILVLWYFAHGCASFSAAPEYEVEEKEENLSEENFEEVSHLDDDAEEQDSDDGEEQLETEEGDDLGDNYDDYGLSSYDDATDVSSVSSC